MTVDATLLDGPRGRRLVLELACASDPAVRRAVLEAGYELDPGRGTSRVWFVGMVRGTGAPPPEPEDSSAAEVAAMLDEIELAPPDAAAWMSAFDRSVAHAMYWQPPDGEDVLAATPEIHRALERLVVGLDQPGWWSAPFDAATQALVEWDSDVPAPPAAPVDSPLAGWAARVRAGEARAAERPADPGANWSGDWWSAPVFGTRSTTRTLLDTGPVGLWLVEDHMGWRGATVRAVEIPADLRVLEVASAEDWAALCRRHPLEVTASRRHDWFRTTGRAEGHWVIPDWEAVAGEWDAVHLATSAYLAAAGTTIEVDGDTASVIAGWDPDATYWLGRSPAFAAEPERWVRNDDGDWVRDR